jgi:hypothetical protein
MRSIASRHGYSARKSHINPNHKPSKPNKADYIFGGIVVAVIVLAIIVILKFIF